MIAPLIVTLTGLRKAAGMTQDALAPLIGVSDATVSKWEGCLTKPARPRLLRWCEVFEYQATEEELAAAAWAQPEDIQAISTTRPAAGDWVRRGACRGEDTALFFAAPSDELSREKAKAICWRCPVMDECRDWALAWGSEQHGTAGGMTEDERRQFRRQTNRRAFAAQEAS
ncbi:MAG: WhiB family transcriptional regulator [Gemmatimonadaceae bacterium]